MVFFLSMPGSSVMAESQTSKGHFSAFSKITSTVLVIVGNTAIAW